MRIDGPVFFIERIHIRVVASSIRSEGNEPYVFNREDCEVIQAYVNIHHLSIMMNIFQSPPFYTARFLFGK